MDKTRSTSPPKSACPGGVHDIDTVASPLYGRIFREYRNAAFLSPIRSNQGLDPAE